MNAVPYIKFPTLEDLEKYKDTIPGFDDMISIIQAEEARGNVVVNIGDAGCMPQETLVIVDFAYEPKCEYENIKVCNMIKDHPYKYLMIRSKKGDTRLDFGAWKYRMKDELKVMIQKRLDEMEKQM